MTFWCEIKTYPLRYLRYFLYWELRSSLRARTDIVIFHLWLLPTPLRSHAHGHSISSLVEAPPNAFALLRQYAMAIQYRSVFLANLDGPTCTPQFYFR